MCTFDECRPVETAATLEALSDGDSSYDGLSGPGGLQPRQHATMEAPLGPPIVQSLGASVSVGVGISQ